MAVENPRQTCARGEGRAGGTALAALLSWVHAAALA
jgi:hypothetical protein